MIEAQVSLDKQNFWIAHETYSSASRIAIQPQTNDCIIANFSSVFF